MYRIRLHGRGGQGIKTGGRALASAFFAAGYEVQDAPHYGAERRGAPVAATVRAAREPIHERGPLPVVDVVAVADETVIPAATAGVLAGVDAHTVVLIRGVESGDTWRRRLGLAGPVLVLPAPTEVGAERQAGVACAAAVAGLVGVVSRAGFEAALRDELAALGSAAVAASGAVARAAWDAMEPHAGSVGESPPPRAEDLPPPDWIDLAAEPAGAAAPAIWAPATSLAARTGLWRTQRPVIDPGLCHRCVWVCTTFCPDGAIDVGPDGFPRIDYEHCKGCLVCAAVCAPHAIHVVPEREAARPEEEMR